MKGQEIVVDTAIFGGGWSGIGVALTLAKKTKQKVMIIEPGTSLAWETTRAALLRIGESESGLGKSLVDLFMAKGGVKSDLLDPPIAEIYLTKTLTEAGIEILFNHRPSGIAVGDGAPINGIKIAGKSGEMVVKAANYVDASENGILLSQVATASEFEYTMFVNYSNGLPDQLKDIPEGDFGSGTRFFPGIWDNEIVLKFSTSSNNPGVARLEAEEKLEEFQKKFDPGTSGMLTHNCCELLPLNEDRKGLESTSKNLYSSGIHTLKAVDNNVSGRIAVGEKVAGAIAESPSRFPIDASSLSAVYATINPQEINCEVLVCGGGTAGVVAAIAAARLGADTILLEASSALGGIGTGGAIHSYYHGVAGGLQDEIDEKTDALTKQLCGDNSIRGFHPGIKEIVLEKMVADAGVKVIYGATVFAADKTPFTSKLTQVQAVTPDGLVNCQAKCFIDSTGDGDVAAMAGAEFSYGRSGDCLAHAFSQPGGYLRDHDLGHANFDAGYCDPTDPFDLSQARVTGVSQYEIDGKFTTQTRPLYIAPILGLRDGRHIHGEYSITLRDQLEYREFPDVIAYGYSHYDNHAYDYENESDQALQWVWGLGNFCALIGSEIPYRCLVPKQIDGLLIACRAISLEQDAHHQCRMQRDLQRIGEAAGIAAALSVSRNTLPRKLEVKLIQDELVKSGGLKNPQQGYHDPSWYPEEKFVYAELFKEKQDQLMKKLKSPKDSPVFLDALVKLTMAGDKIVVPELIALVEERNSQVPEGHKTVEAWKLAIGLLGILEAPEAAGAIAEVLATPKIDLATITVSIRALGRIGNPKYAAIIDKAIATPKLPVEQCLQSKSPAGIQSKVEVLWRLELVAAEALAKLGVDRRDLVVKYLNDPRATARRFAVKVEKFLQEELQQMEIGKTP